MNPLPPAIIARWQPMWAKDSHGTRPWWKLCRGAVMVGAFGYWRRCDGYETTKFSLPVTWTVDDILGGLLPNAESVRVLEELSAIDAAHPLPAPPPLPGQVWATPRPGYGDGWGYHLVTVAAPFVGDSWLVHLGGDGSVAQTYRMGEATPDASAWPPPGAILVAGPTPWGFSIPWSPA